MDTYNDMHRLFTGDLLSSTKDRICVEYAEKRKDELAVFVNHPGTKRIREEYERTGAGNPDVIRTIMEMTNELYMVSAWLLWREAKKQNATPENLMTCANTYQKAYDDFITKEKTA